METETSANGRRFGDGNVYQRTFPFGNTTIFVSGGAGPGAASPLPFAPPSNENVDFGTFLHTIMGQLAGGLMGATAAPPNLPMFVMTFLSLLSSPLLSSTTPLSFRFFQNPTGGTFVNATDIDTFLTQVTLHSSDRSGR